MYFKVFPQGHALFVVCGILFRGCVGLVLVFGVLVCLDYVLRATCWGVLLAACACLRCSQVWLPRGVCGKSENQGVVLYRKILPAPSPTYVFDIWRHLLQAACLLLSPTYLLYLTQLRK